MKVAPITSVASTVRRQSTSLSEPFTFTNQVQAYPNPCTDQFTISLTLAQPADLSLQIYTPTGQPLRQLDFGLLGAGKQQVRWNGRDNQNQIVKPGLYLYRTVVNGQLRTGKLFKTE